MKFQRDYHGNIHWKLTFIYLLWYFNIYRPFKAGDRVTGGRFSKHQIVKSCNWFTVTTYNPYKIPITTTTQSYYWELKHSPKSFEFTLRKLLPILTHRNS